MSSRPIPLLILCALPCGMWPAMAAGNPTEPGDLQNPLEPLDQCATCHAFPNAAPNAGEPNYSPIGWSGSMMANAARDPIFWAGVAIAAQDDPTHTEDCVRCHSPRAFLDGRGDAIAIDELMPEDLSGVDCDLCHRMVDDGMTPPGNARYVIDDVDVGGKVPKRGPWSYGVDAPNHPWSDDSAFTASSQLCGTCHDVTTARERVDDEGVGMGVPFNEQRTYREWLNSEFAQPGPDAASCQDCHMPAVENAAGCGTFEAEDKAHPTGARRHELVGANRFMVQLLRQQYGDAGTGEISDNLFDYTIERLDEFVQGAVSFEVQFPGTVDLEQGIASLPVTVTNESGHKLPTGYSEGRVMWIEVVALYREIPVWTSGLWDGQVIEDDAQVHRYEAIAEDFDDGESFHLLRNNHWVVDNRLPPRGLVEDPETDPITQRYAPNGGVWPHTDTVDYAFAPAELDDATPDDDTDDELVLRVRLLYLINTPEYVDFLADENGINSAGTDVQALFDELGGSEPVVLAQAEVTVPLTGLGQPDPGETEDSGSGSADGDETDETAGGESDETAGSADDGGGGCGCRANPKRSALGAIPLLMLLGRRRRA